MDNQFTIFVSQLMMPPWLFLMLLGKCLLSSICAGISCLSVQISHQSTTILFFFFSFFLIVARDLCHVIFIHLTLNFRAEEHLPNTLRQALLYKVTFAITCIS